MATKGDVERLGLRFEAALQRELRAQTFRLAAFTALAALFVGASSLQA